MELNTHGLTWEIIIQLKKVATDFEVESEKKKEFPEKDSKALP